jgi:hypothetical protein
MTKVSRFLGWCMLYALPATPAFADLSGTYVASGPNIAVLLQIVETNGQNLTGRYEQVVLQNGKIDDMNATLTGAVNGDVVVATLKPDVFLASDIPVSGNVQGDVLHLTGGDGLALGLVKGEETGFRQKVSVFQEQVRQIANEQAKAAADQERAKHEADRANFVQGLIERLIAFNTRAESALPKFAPAEQHWHAITEKMREGISLYQSLNGPAIYERGQINVSLTQAAIRANQIHISANGAHQQFDTEVNELADQADQVDQWCQDPPGYLSSSCPQFADTRKAFKQRASELRAAFAELEGTWSNERREQERIVDILRQPISH